MNATLLKREIKANYKLTLIFIGVLAIYASMIVSMFDPELGDSLTIMAKSMPELFAAFGMGNAIGTLIEFMANYLYGILLVCFPMVYIIILSGKLVSRYVDRGSMAYLLATPCRRAKLIITQIVVLLLGIVTLLIFVTTLCILCAQGMFPGELDISKFLLLNLGVLGVHVFWAGICFCSSCLFNDAKYATGVGASLCVGFVLIQMVGNVGEKFEAVKYATPLTLFNPMALVAGDAWAYWGVGALYATGMLLMAVGAVAFCKRDIPV